ncbi:nuclear protein Es2 [Babesia caballi]|uniref:Nuclear protein Es2 n=1 Tax=Babesia caballi TaxID=5871 RepID=A0AAV4LSY8_BABCB|nr:nuclear protein Es2 [Babesia caballi]
MSLPDSERSKRALSENVMPTTTTGDVDSISLGDLGAPGVSVTTHCFRPRQEQGCQSQHCSPPTPGDSTLIPDQDNGLETHEGPQLPGDGTKAKSGTGDSSSSSFENTVLDPKINIATLGTVSRPDNPANSSSPYETLPAGSQVPLNQRRDTLANLPSGRQDWRANSVSTAAKDPIVPYADVIKRIQTSYKLKELCEEDYVGCIESIIERDYFPHLAKLRMTNMLMEAENRGDTETAALVRKQLRDYDSDQELNVQLRTLGNESVSVNIGKGGLKLDQFCRIFTSEDNRSFGRLMEQTIIRRNQQSGWMVEGERRHNLALAETQAKTNLGIRDGNVQSNRAVSRNSFFFNQSTASQSNGDSATIISANTSLPPDHDAHMDELDRRQKARRTERVKETYHGKINELIAQHGLRECRELLDDEQMAKYDFVQTPLTIGGSDPGYTMPKPIPREELADRLRKKYHSTSAGTPMAKTPSGRTPLIVQRLIAKHNSGADLQLRNSYSSSKHSRGSVRSGVLFKS